MGGGSKRIHTDEEVMTKIKDLKESYDSMRDKFKDMKEENRKRKV